MGVGEDDQAVRNSYRLLGAVSLLQLAITLTLQFNNYRHRQRARQEWKLYRSLEPRYGRSKRSLDITTVVFVAYNDNIH